MTTTPWPDGHGRPRASSGVYQHPAPPHGGTSASTAWEGDFAKAREDPLQVIQPLPRPVPGTTPIPVKTAMNLMGMDAAS
jgi:hypothetical protein